MVEETKCRECNKIIILDKKHPNHIFCSSNCQKRNYRKYHQNELDDMKRWRQQMILNEEKATERADKAIEYLKNKPKDGTSEGQWLYKNHPELYE